MPRIDLIPRTLYNPTDPYHFQFDNLPLENILLRIDLVNAAVDRNIEEIRAAGGTQGSLSTRLARSMEPNGDLTTQAVDATLHSIEDHQDNANFVRMTNAERAKLSNVSNDATALKLQVTDVSQTFAFEDEQVILENSDTLTWAVIPPNRIRGDLAFPPSAAHQHHYNLTPLTSDNQNFVTTTVNTPYIVNSLRVYVNGVRLSPSPATVPVFDAMGNSTQTYFAEDDPTMGTFMLNRVLSVSEVIRIDFDQSFV